MNRPIATDRRAVLTGLGAILLVPAGVHAQQPGKVYRLGLLTFNFPVLPALMEPFVAEMRERGWVEGRNLVIERRVSPASAEESVAAARELVDRGADVIVTVYTGAAVAARRATTSVPIVMWTSGYPVEAGLVASLARPGGNVTGSSNYAGGDLFSKYLELLRALAPRMTRLGVLWDYWPPVAMNEESRIALDGLARAAAALGVATIQRDVKTADDVAPALVAFSRERLDALFATSGPVHGQRDVASKILAFAAGKRIPTMSDFAGAFFSHGALMAYSANPTAVARRAAYFVDRIFRGTSPADLPIERPAKFDLLINVKTAKAIGLAVPPPLLLQADRVIE